MDRARVIDAALLTLLLIGVSAFPVDLLIHDFFWYYVVEALLMIFVFLVILLYERRHPEINPPSRRLNLVNLLLFIPTLIAAFSNFIYALFLKEQPQPLFGLYNIPQVIFIVFNVIVEEYVFRKHILGNLNHPKTIVRILISAAIFALCHLTIFFSTFSFFDLIIVAYSFGLGMVLGFIYCYTNSLIACIGFHLTFNLFNDFLFERLFGVSNQLWYYLINVFVAIIVGLYLLVFYLVKLRKNIAETRYLA